MPVPANQTDHLPTYTVTVYDVRIAQLLTCGQSKLIVYFFLPPYSQPPFGFIADKLPTRPTATAAWEWSSPSIVVTMISPIPLVTSKKPLWLTALNLPPPPPPPPPLSQALLLVATVPATEMATPMIIVALRLIKPRQQFRLIRHTRTNGTLHPAPGLQPMAITPFLLHLLLLKGQIPLLLGLPSGPPPIHHGLAPLILLRLLLKVMFTVLLLAVPIWSSIPPKSKLVPGIQLFSSCERLQSLKFSAHLNTPYSRQKNHTVTQSSFADPCRRLSTNGILGFDSDLSVQISTF